MSDDDSTILHDPVPHGALWLVVAEDTVLGVKHEKVFRSLAQAKAFCAELRTGVAAEDPLAQPRQLKRPIDANTQATDYAVPSSQVNRKASAVAARHRGPGDGMHLRKVVEVLESYGLDPTAEIAEALLPYDEVQEDGTVVTAYRLDTKERVKAHLELLQYAHPKLKAVEVTNKTDLTDEQTVERITALMAKAAKR